MTCKDYITIVKGNDTDWNGANFLTINLVTEILDLSKFKAVLDMAGVIKPFDDLSSGSIEVNLTATETKNLPPFFNGVLNLIDSTNKVATIESLIPFKVISTVHNNAIATEPYTLNFDVKQGGETILTVNVESAVSVEVRQTTTLPAGSDATVTNVGTGNHLVLDFGIPQGIQGEQGEQGVPGEQGIPGRDATINGHNAISLVPGTGIDITDNSGFITISNTQTSAEWGNITGDIANQYDLQQALNGKENTISDLADIRSGAEAGATALQPDDVINNTSSSDTDKPLSAAMGLSLQNQVDNLNSRGRFLALWNCSTGLAQSNPPESPYLYKSGDYFIVGTAGTTNYKPTGSSYTTGIASTVVETAEVSVDDVYYYDGTQWRLQVNTQKTLAFVNIAGDPYDNTNLASALNAKQDELTQGTGIDITSNTISNSGVRSVSTGATNGTISVNTGGTNVEVSVYGLGTAAYTSSTDYATSAQGTKADSAVQDVQVNGSSVTLDGVANIPKASSNTLGTIMIGSGLAIQQSGSVYVVAATESNLINKLNSSNPVVSTNLNIAVREGLGNNNLTWSDTYKSNARTTIGAVGDVQVNGTSVTTSGVANIPVATNQVFGVVKQGNGNETGITVPNGIPTVYPASTTRIDNRTGSAPIVPTNLDYAVKASITNNANTLTTTEKGNACDWLGAIKDVQVDSTSIVSSGVANIPKASNDGTVVGVVQLSNTYGSQTVNGYLAAVDRSYNGFVGAQSTSIASVGGVKSYVGGMSVAYNASQSLTDAQKIQARTNIGAQVAGDYELSSTIQALSATDSITLADNTIYNGGEQTALTITLPATADVSFLCEIDFTSGNSPTTLSYSNTIKWAGDDTNNNVFLPVASKRYTIICAYDGVNYRFTVKGVE